MKNLFVTMLMGGTAASLIAADGATQPPTDFQITIFNDLGSRHELNPNVRYINHKETNYDYEKIIGGIEYNFSQQEGVNFTSFLGYSVSNDKSFFQADWGLKYLFSYDEEIDFYPMVGLSNSSHFLSNLNGETFQIYRSSFNASFAGIYRYADWLHLDGGLGFFKDLSTNVVLRKGDEFWGKVYHNPTGFRTFLNLKFPKVLNKDLIVGAFYAKTIKHCYKEFGLNASVVFCF